ncbi:hypothetical protein F5882DRAFT_309995, partial [Hyaloscypha sp. PMI_1271]
QEIRQSWNVANDLETLPEQRITQFELMTGRKAPVGRMRLEVLNGIRMSPRMREALDLN